MADPLSNDVDAEEAAALLSDLIAIDTQNPPGRERDCATFIHEALSEWGIRSRLVDEPFADRPQVVAEIGRGDPDAGALVLNGHMDVVPPGDHKRWTHDPFGGAIEDGRAYGRGASDMKSGLAAAMLAGRVAAESDAVDGTLLLTFAVGEETAEPGTKHLVKELDADFGVVLEPTELVVDTAGKGLAFYTATIRGKSCHASRPHLGRNALAAAASMHGSLSAYQQRIGERTNPLLGQSLCTPTVMRAGEKENVIPNTAELRFDRRFLPSERLAGLDREMKELFDPIRDEFDVTVERTRTYEAAEIPVDADIAEVFRRWSHEVAGVDTSPHGKNAATDQRNFVNDAGIPAIIWGPGTPAQSHAVDEYARVDLLVQAVEVLCRSIGELCTT
jgi:succinyl-diaminopimelate desuccinylase